MRDVIACVPREPFIPDEIFVRDEAGRLVPVRRADDPERWRLQVESDAPVVTRVGPDPSLPAGICDPGTGEGMVSTSSSSAPSIMVRLIEAMELEHGMRVLEIGTGTGYNAAVLARIVGAENVVSIELDPVAASRAREALASLALPVEVISGDGEDGYPPRAPYDRVISTASAHTIPYKWVQQTRPGGLVLVPLAPTVHPDWPLVALRVRGDGTARGQCLGASPFMPLRAQQVSVQSVRRTEERWVAAGRPDSTRFGLTVNPSGQRIWLDSPDEPVG